MSDPLFGDTVSESKVASTLKRYTTPETKRIALRHYYGQEAVPVEGLELAMADEVAQGDAKTRYGTQLFLDFMNYTQQLQSEKPFEYTEGNRKYTELEVEGGMSYDPNHGYSYYRGEPLSSINKDKTYLGRVTMDGSSQKEGSFTIHSHPIADYYDFSLGKFIKVDDSTQPSLMDRKSSLASESSYITSKRHGIRRYGIDSRKDKVTPLSEFLTNYK